MTRPGKKQGRWWAEKPGEQLGVKGENVREPHKRAIANGPRREKGEKTTKLQNKTN